MLEHDYPPITIDQAIEALTAAKKILGSDACLILSLWGSSLPDANVKGFTVIHDKDNRYLQVDVVHPDLCTEEVGKEPKKTTRTVECFLCWTDNTWTTDFIEIPADTDDDRMTEVISSVVSGRRYVKDLAFAGLYNSMDDEEEDDGDEETEEEDETGEA